MNKEEEQELQKLIKRKLPTDKELKRVEICLMKWELPEVEIECIRHLINNTHHPYKLTILDTRKLSVNERGQRCGINTSKIWNRFIRESSCDYMLIMDTDAFVEPGWLEEIMKVFDKYPDADVVAPVSMNRGVTPEQEVQGIENKVIKAPSHVSGYCFAFRKEMLKDIGLFDEDFYYFGQDSDFCERIGESKKWNIYICLSAIVNHGKEGKWSYSSNKANEDPDNIWKWEIDREYAQKLALLKKQLRGKNPKIYPHGGIAYKENVKKTQ